VSVRETVVAARGGGDPGNRRRAVSVWLGEGL